MTNKELISKLDVQGVLQKQEFVQLLSTYTDDDLKFAQKLARETAIKYFGNKIYIRGLLSGANLCTRVGDDAPILHVYCIGRDVFEPRTRVEYGALAESPTTVAVEMTEDEGFRVR